MALGIDLELKLPSENATVPLVRHLLRHTLTEFGVSAQCVADVELAVTEAAANVVEHAGEEDDYQIRVLVDEVQCEIQVMDSGPGFRPDVTGDFPTGQAEGGRGLLLMQALVDRLTFEPNDEAGTIVRLVKLLEFDDAPLIPAKPVPPHRP
jgi:serine/threonine-protein kinase RsbW